MNVIICSEYLKERLDSICARHGLTGPQYNVLRILKGAGASGLSRTEIQKRMIQRSPDISRMIERLGRMSLVVKTKDENDKRLSVAKISQRGVALLDEMVEDVSTFSTLLSKHLTRLQAYELSRLCERIYGEVPPALAITDVEHVDNDGKVTTIQPPDDPPCQLTEGTDDSR